MLVELLSFYRVDRSAEELPAVRHDAELDIAIAPDFLRLDIDLHHARIGGNYRVPTAGKKSDSGPEHEDQVGAAPGLGVNPRVDGAEPPEREAVIFGNRATRFGVGHHRCVCEFRKLD